jgi:hypothetical protein
VEVVRKYKSEKQISMWAEIPSLIISWPVDYIKQVKQYSDDISGVTKAFVIEFLEKDGIATLIGN